MEYNFLTTPEQREDFERVRTYWAGEGCKFPTYDVRSVGGLADAQHSLCAIAYSFLKSSHRPKGCDNVPKGNWYMVTITAPKGSDKSAILTMHEQFVSNISDRAHVQHASLEFSSIWHIHYLVNWKSGYAKNLQRDVQRASGSKVVDVGRMVTSLKSWNGLCNYLLKRTYDEKAETKVSYLIEGIRYTEGCGYTLL